MANYYDPYGGVGLKESDVSDLSGGQASKTYGAGGGTAAASGSGTGGGMEPMTAGMMVGGQFLAQYLAQRAQEEENRKKALQEAIQTQGQQEQNAMSNMGNWYARALLK